MYDVCAHELNLSAGLFRPTAGAGFGGVLSPPSDLSLLRAMSWMKAAAIVGKSGP